MNQEGFREQRLCDGLLEEVYLRLCQLWEYATFEGEIRNKKIIQHLNRGTSYMLDESG